MRSKRIARLVFASIVLVTAISATEAYRTMNAFLSSNRSAIASSELLETMNRLQSILVDAETGVQGYVISGNRWYLEPYEAATAALQGTLDDLRERLGTTPEGAAQFSTLNGTIAERMRNLQAVTLLRSDKGFAAASDIVATGEGKRLMDDVRRQIARMHENAEIVFRARQDSTADQLARAKQLFLVLAFLAGTLVALAAILVERDFARTEHQLASESTTLHERSEQTRATHDSIIDAIISIDERGTIESVNAATERLFGHGATELLGQNVKMLMPSPYRDEHDGYLANYLRSGVPKIIGIGREVVAQRKDGSTFPVDLAVSEARVRNRRLFTGVVRDLTDRKQAAMRVKELERAVEERGRLSDIGAVTAQIVHDLGNPLAGLSMQVQRLQRLARAKQPDTAPIRSMADQILGTVGRLDGMLHELGDFARQHRLDLSPVDPAQVLFNTKELWLPVASAKGIVLRLDVRHDAPQIFADEAKLIRVLDNLVKNAIEAIHPDAGSITLTLDEGSSPGRPVRISISDTGSGIPESVDVFRLFETTKATGSGLGLSIARRLIESHGGGLTFARVNPHGTVFHIELPLRPQGIA